MLLQHLKGNGTDTWIGRAQRDMDLLQANGISMARHRGWHGQDDLQGLIYMLHVL